MTPLDPNGSRPQLNRRTFLAAALAAGGGGLLAAMGGGGAGAATISAATKVKAAGSDLGAIEHVIFFMQENRSFDHYYGAYKGVRGFDDHPKGSLGAFAQAWPGGASSHLLPFHLQSDSGMGECTYDLNHTWAAEHLSRGAGHNADFVKTHTSRGVRRSPERRVDHGLLHTSGPSVLLRVGRCLHHLRQLPLFQSWAPRIRTGSWRFRGPSIRQGEPGVPSSPPTRTSVRSGAQAGPPCPRCSKTPVSAGRSTTPRERCTRPAFFEQNGLLVGDAILPYFSQYKNPSSSLYQKAFLPQYPSDFVSDVASGNLPSVSWILPPDGYDEHPPAPPALGEWFTSQMLKTLVSNPDVWSKTVLFHMYDENDGFFDHVPPPTAPPGTAGEYLTASSLPSGTDGVRGPIGMGFRVPMLVLSPFSRGGYVASEVFDHTSQLRFLEERFGVRAPNLSTWRREHAGDLTSTLHMHHKDASTPSLPSTSKDLPADVMAEGCTQLDLLEASANKPAYPVPKHQIMARQEPGRAQRV